MIRVPRRPERPPVPDQPASGPSAGVLARLALTVLARVAAVGFVALLSSTVPIEPIAYAQAAAAQAPAPPAAATPSAAAALDGLDAFIEDAMKAWQTPGLGVAIIDKGQIVSVKGYGLRDVEAKQPVTPDTIFAIGSTTKAFTTMVLGMLADEGKVGWDEPVRTWFPGFALYDRFSTERMTPRDLVTHRSGLPRHDLMWYGASLSREEMVARLRYLQPNADLRTKMQYQNLMYMTAGYLTGHVTGSSWEEQVRTRILTPLGMTRTNFSVADSEKDANAAAPYVLNKNVPTRVPFRDITQIGPAGSINASLRDMARWAQLHVNGGQAGGRQLISASGLADMHRPQIPIENFPGLVPEPEIVNMSYGLGWFVESYRGVVRVHHGGNIDGFSAMVSLVPANGVAIVAITNTGGSALPTIVARHVTDRLLGLSPIDWNGRALKRRDVGERASASAKASADLERRTGTSPSHALRDFAGTYEHPAYGQIEIAADDQGLRATFHKMPMRLTHWHYDTFRAENQDKALAEAKLFIQFQTNQQGDVARLSVPLEPLVDPIVFAKLPPARLSDPTFLSTLAGTYVLPDNAAFSLTVKTKGNGLTVSLPGQPALTLVPSHETTFLIKEMSGYAVRFVLDGSGAASEARLIQPNGVYVAKRGAS